MSFFNYSDTNEAREVLICQGYQDSEEIIITKKIANLINLLLFFAIEGTTVSCMLKKMYNLCVQSILKKNTTINYNSNLSINTLKYLNFTFKYISSGSVPMAFSAISPYFLFSKIFDNDESKDVKSDIKKLLNSMINDQTAENKKKIKHILSKSMLMHSLITFHHE